MHVESIRTASLGDSTYVLEHEGYALVVDPQRDLDRFRPYLEGLTVTHVLETHVHNDYVSGGRDLARRTGADLVLPAGSGASFAFRPAFHHEDLEGDGGVTVRPLHTPGHTPEHVSYLVLIDGVPTAVFTGGSLLVGSAGRSDLLGEEFARQLAVLQYGSLQRLAALPDAVGVYPTHGEGSFCTASGAGRSTSTIGAEKASNPLYRFTSSDEFATAQLAELGPYPAYYPYMAPVNRVDPTAVETPQLVELTPAAVAERMTAGVPVLDIRDRYEYAAGHIPGSLGLELGDSFAPWAGWLLRFDSPVVLVVGPDQSPGEAAIELARIGFMQVEGYLRGVDGWGDEGRQLDSYQTVTAAELARLVEAGITPQIVDVRDPFEFAAGHIEGSVHHYVPDLLSGLPAGIDPTQEVWLICRTGARASIAAGLVEGLDLAPVVVAKGGVFDVLAADA